MTANDSSSLGVLTWWQACGRFFRKDLLPVVTDLRLAILLLLTIAVASVLGTVIEQGESLGFYQANYPEHPALFGFLSWKVILVLGLDRVYRTWWFLGLLILFGASLTACTFTRQLPALKAARRWKFYTEPRQFQKLALSVTTQEHSLEALEPLLKNFRYRLFREGNSLYARKGIIGRIGPIIVHASMLLILGGAIWGTMTGIKAQELIPSGETVGIDNIIDAGPWSQPQQLRQWSLQVNRFWIDYTPEGDIDQFYSDLSVVNPAGEEVHRKTIRVNDPLRFKGFTAYQTDWGIAGVRVRVNNSPIFRLPMAELDTQGRGRIWGTWIPTKPDLSEGVSLIARDLQGTLLVYDMAGNLSGTVRAGMSLPVNGVELKVLEMLGSTGLQIKVDPGIPWVYAGFGLLMLSAIASYASHSQVWALEQDGVLYLGARTNRAQVALEQEFFTLLERLQGQEQKEA